MKDNFPDDVDPRPKRRRSKDNPYELFTVGIGTPDVHYYISFRDGQGVQVCMEIGKSLYELLDRFELEDVSHFNEADRHYEKLDLSEAELSRRSAFPPESLEDEVFRQIEYEQLHKAILRLPEIQRRRLLLYFFEGLTYEQIGEQEGCSKMAVKFSIDRAVEHLKKELRNFLF